MNPWQSPEEIPRSFSVEYSPVTHTFLLREIYDSGTRVESQVFVSIGELKRVRDWAIKSGKHINDYE